MTDQNRRYLFSWLSDVISIILVLARTGVSLEDFVFSLFPRALPFIHALSSWSMHVTALDLNRQIQRFDVLFADGDRVWFDMVPLRQSAQQPVPGWTASVGLQYATISSNWWSVAMAGVGLATPIQAGNGLGYFNVFYGIWASELQRVALDVAVDICGPWVFPGGQRWKQWWSSWVPASDEISGILHSPAFRSAMKQLHRYHLAMALAATSSMTRGLSTDAKLQMSTQMQLGSQVFTCPTFLREICWGKTM